MHDAGGVKVVVSAAVTAAGEEKDDEDDDDDATVEVASVVLEPAAAADEAEVEADSCVAVVVVDMLPVVCRRLTSRLAGVAAGSLVARGWLCGAGSSDQMQAALEEDAAERKLGGGADSGGDQTQEESFGGVCLPGGSGRRSAIVY